MVADSKVGTENYEMLARYKGKPVAAMALRLAAGANALGFYLARQVLHLRRHYDAPLPETARGPTATSSL